MAHGLFVEASQFAQKLELYNREMASQTRYKSMQSTRLLYGVAKIGKVGLFGRVVYELSQR